MLTFLDISQQNYPFHIALHFFQTFILGNMADVIPVQLCSVKSSFMFLAVDDSDYYPEAVDSDGDYAYIPMEGIPQYTDLRPPGERPEESPAGEGAKESPGSSTLVKVRSLFPETWLWTDKTAGYS